MRVVEINEHGGPDVLRLAERDDPAPGRGEVVVEVAAAGVNYIDTYHRSGLYPVSMPFVPGREGSGVVVAVGPGVDDIEIGSPVAFLAGATYAERVVVPVASLVPVPTSVDLDQAAAVLLQGLTAHALTTTVVPLEPGDRCLVHAGAGGVGLLAIQMAKLRGAEVFATVGSEAKAEVASAAGADHVIRYRHDDFVTAVEAIAGPRPLRVVYDGVGADTVERGFDLLARRGTMVSFGNASGPPPPVAPLRLRDGSLSLTRPSLADFVVERSELDRRSAELFSWMAEGQLRVMIGHRFGLAEAGRAHELLESRATTGKVLLTAAPPPPATPERTGSIR